MEPEVLRGHAGPPGGAHAEAIEFWFDGMADAKPRRRINTNAIIWAAAVVALILIFYGVRQLTRPRLPLRVTTPELENLVRSSSTNGKVEPVSNFAAHAPLAGVVRELYVHAGEQVKKGQLLLQLDGDEARASVAQATAALRLAEANLQAVQGGGTQQQQLALSSSIEVARMNRDHAASDLAAVQKLEAQGAAAPDEVARLKQQLATANASLASLERQQAKPFAPADLNHAKAAVAQAQSARAAAAQTLADSNVRAPFTGVVYSLPVSRYDYVQPGSTLLAMADLSKMRVRAYFDEPEIGNLSVGDPVTIVWNAKPGITWRGKITALPSTVTNYGTRTVGEVLVSIETPPDGLLPNTDVTVTVVTQEVPDALTVPLEALHIEDGRNYVYVVAGDKLRRRQVEVGTRNLTQMQILSGISKNAVVALGTTNGAPVTEGIPIHIVR